MEGCRYTRSSADMVTPSDCSAASSLLGSVLAHTLPLLKLSELSISFNLPSPLPLSLFLSCVSSQACAEKRSEWVEFGNWCSSQPVESCSPVQPGLRCLPHRAVTTGHDKEAGEGARSISFIHSDIALSRHFTRMPQGQEEKANSRWPCPSFSFKTAPCSPRTWCSPDGRN